MQDDFEHKLSQRMQEFSITPQPEIWQRVEAALPEKRSRRFAFWWWLLPLVIGAGAGLWWLGNSHNRNELRQVAQQKADESQTIPPNKTATPVTTIKDSTLLLTKTATVYSKQNPDTIAKERIADSAKKISFIQDQKPVIATEQKIKASDKKINVITYSSSVKAKLKAVNKNDKKESLTATLNKSNTNSALKEKQLKKENDNLKAKDVLQNGNAINNPDIGNQLALQSGVDNSKLVIDKVDSIILVSATTAGTNDTTAKKEVAATQQDTIRKNEMIAVKKSAKKLSNKKAAWLADAAIGTSWLKGTSSLDKRVGVADNFYSSPTTGGNVGAGGNYTSRSFARPGAGFNLSLGVARRQELNRYVGWQAALHYKLLSATQQVGSTVDTPSFYSRASAPSLIYNTGNRRTYQNIVHQLQFSPALVFTLNPAAHLPFSITTGAAVAYNVSNNLLLHDYRSGTYIRSAKSSSKMQYSAYIGMDIWVQKKIQLGVMYQHSFSNVARGDLGSDYQWRQLQFHVSLPISKY